MANQHVRKPDLPSSSCRKLIDLLRDSRRVFIQTHDFPDHDSVASAFGLQHLLRTQGIESSITYEGELQRESLLALVEALDIQLLHNGQHRITPDDSIVIVDGCAGNRNVSHLVGLQVGVIDHHISEHPDDVPYVDIRPQFGACSSIVYDYFRELQVEVTGPVATALLAGVAVDTAQLMRGASENDMRTYTALFRRADVGLVTSVIQNSVQARDLTYYRAALDSIVINDRFAFCYLANGCSRNLLGILGDFFIGLREVDVAVVCARDTRRVNFSIRSSRDRWNASEIIQDALRGIGRGGGHRHMAGGSTHDHVLPDAEAMQRRFCTVLGADCTALSSSGGHSATN